MIRQPQTRPHPNGDCLRACVATLLEYPVAEVPDWTAMRDDPDAKYPPFWIEMQHFLKARGYAFLEVQLAQKTWMPLPYETLAVFIGPHATGARHAIIGRCEGSKFYPVFDPLNPDGDPGEAFVNHHIEAVCFLVPLDPARLRLARPGNVIRIPNVE